MVFKDICVLVLWAKVALALEGLTDDRVGHQETEDSTNGTTYK